MKNYKDNNLFFLGELQALRERSLMKKKQLDNSLLDKPVTFWIKEDRLLNEVGKEFTIILRTKGCSWALGETGGCSMCGYVQDANIEEIDQNRIIKQFEFAYNDKIGEITSDGSNYVLKIFNSGSFFDDSEISTDVRKYIYKKVANVDNIKEFVVESRVEYITPEKLRELSFYLKGKYVEIAIGLESANDYIRIYYINKGMVFEEFTEVLTLCNEFNIGVKAYLLLKPPFLNEQGAIDDCVASINRLIDLNVNTISINPLNIQKGTLAERLWYQNRYRPPWFHSLFKVLKKSLTQEKLTQVRIVSDPSGAGSKRGIHNCLKKECEKSSQMLIKKFTLSQNLAVLDQQEHECECKRIYQLQKSFY
ncbi:MAG: archaeosine biosynthesis radical SAM protein RaSEA [Promethearchaeota archaeon]|jgi:radical SAM enzyme (TIGR01210 family)